MQKTKTIRTFQRKTKSGKMSTVREHTAKYDSPEEMAKEAMKRKAGAGEELEKRKLDNSGNTTGGSSTPSHGVSPEEYKAWYHWDQNTDPKNKLALSAEKKMKAHMGATAYKQHFKTASDTYSVRGHSKSYKNFDKQESSDYVEEAFNRGVAAAHRQVKKMDKENPNWRRENKKGVPSTNKVKQSSEVKRQDPVKNLYNFVKDSDVTYTNKGSIEDKEFGNMRLYALQKKHTGMSVSFTASDRRMVIYEEGRKTPLTDNSQAKKFNGGLTYEYRPLTRSMASKINQMVSPEKDHSNSGNKGVDKGNPALLRNLHNKYPKDKADQMYKEMMEKKPGRGTRGEAINRSLKGVKDAHKYLLGQD